MQRFRLLKQRAVSIIVTVLMELPTTCGPHSNQTPTVEVIECKRHEDSWIYVHVNVHLPETIKTAKQN